MEVMQEDYGGYAGRLRRLWTEEKARDRSVPDGSDKYDSFSDVGEIRVYWRADFQSGSRVLKKVF